jgi:hypothetical protein
MFKDSKNYWEERERENKKKEKIWNNYLDSETKKIRKQQAEELFNEGDYYQEIFLNGMWYVKSLLRGSGRRPDKWIISEYTPESFNRYKGYTESEYHQQNKLVKNLFNSY